MSSILEMTGAEAQLRPPLLPRRESGGPGSNKFYRGRDTEDEPRTGRDSSVTESASEAEAETSRDTPSPRPGPAPHRQDIPLPPEQLETKQLKKLETMKESPA